MRGRNTEEMIVGFHELQRLQKSGEQFTVRLKFKEFDPSKPLNMDFLKQGIILEQEVSFGTASHPLRENELDWYLRNGWMDAHFEFEVIRISQPQGAQQ